MLSRSVLGGLLLSLKRLNVVLEHLIRNVKQVALVLSESSRVNLRAVKKDAHDLAGMFLVPLHNVRVNEVTNRLPFLGSHGLLILSGLLNWHLWHHLLTLGLATGTELRELIALHHDGLTHRSLSGTTLTVRNLPLSWIVVALATPATLVANSAVLLLLARLIHLAVITEILGRIKELLHLTQLALISLLR